MEVKPSWKKEAVEGALYETVFDKWGLLAQVAYQIVVMDLPLTKKLELTQGLLSFVTLEEKALFNITEDDEEALRINLGLIKYYDSLLSYGSTFRGRTKLTSKVLTVEEKRDCLSKPKKDRTYGECSFWIHWDKRVLTRDGKKQLVERMLKERRFMLFGVPVEPKDVYCELESFTPKKDPWVANPRDRDDDDLKAFRHYTRARKFDFGKDDPLSWRVDFYVKNASMLAGVSHAFHESVLKGRKLIGSILQRMMKQFEGKTVYVIPEERKIP